MNNRMFSNLDYKRAFGSSYVPGKVTGLGVLSHQDKKRVDALKPEKPSLGRSIKRLIIGKENFDEIEAKKAKTLNEFYASRRGGR